MLHEFVRVLSYNGSSFVDESISNQDDSLTLDLSLSTTEYIYIGQYFAFNNFFIHVDTANTNTATLSLEYWDGTEWKAVVDLLDATSSGGKTLARSGVVQFAPNKLYSWNRINDTSESSAPLEMQSLYLYDLFWLRLKPSANLSATTDAFSIGYSFTSTQQLNKHDIEINNYYDRFETSKNDWIKEILTASRYLVADLKRKNIIQDRCQVLRFDDVALACEWKALEIIYSNLGKSHIDKRDYALKMYDKFIEIRERSLDKNNDAQLSLDELKGSVRWGVR